MKLLEYLVLAVVGVSVVFGQESYEHDLANETIAFIQNITQENIDAGANQNILLILESGYINGTKCAAKAEGIMNNAISNAKEIVEADQEAAKTIMKQAFEEARNELLTYGIPTAIAYGAALDLSNDGAYQGIKNTSKSVQKAAYSAFEALVTGEVLFVGGIATGGNSSQSLLDACQLAVESGFAGTYNMLQIAIQDAYQALKDAQNSPMPSGQVSNRNCESGESDPEYSAATSDIISAASKAIEYGANADLVQRVKNGLICGIEDYVTLTSQGAQSVEMMKTMAKNDPEAFKVAYGQLVDGYISAVNDIYSGVYITLGAAAYKTEKQPSTGVQAAILEVLHGHTEVGLGVESSIILVKIGLNYGGYAPQIAIDSSLKIAPYIKYAFTKAIVKSAKTAFNAL